MSNEAANVAILKDAYRQWHESKGGSVEQLLSICDPNINWDSVPAARLRWLCNGIQQSRAAAGLFRRP